MSHLTRRRVGIAAALVSSAALVLSACGGGDINSKSGNSASGKNCDSTVNMAVNPWVGFEASAHVVGRVIEGKLGCKVEYKNLKEEVSWQGFGSDVDVVIEDWGHPDLVKKYVDSANPTAVEVGPNGNVGQIGWFVPPWMAKKYPGILDYKNLNKYSKMFKTSESGGKGQLLDGDPSFVTNDEALVKNNKLNFKVVYAGSEAALITAFKQAEEKKTPLIGYFYAPQWFLSNVDLKKVALPKYTKGCDADPAKITCDYPTTNLLKYASKDFMKGGGDATTVVKNFKWTNDDQNLVAKYIAQDKMSADEAADKWIKANPDKVKAWMG
ncbi:ABC transporter substrate-binding protein [Aeromicrobium sp.]|uniref:ABC transporter substrate-binding protein n=1 Tax=Aeromicrobium sp. TaxID=1871063 RepID=UPI0019B65F70|nr:ABC transporter substrate-binding protein [Aeromicrobium sp.]MBC7632642.1 ABC transporter substrate-binding protein [Aeromicrobium sp.]